MPADAPSRGDDPTAARQRFLSLLLRSEREIFRHVAALVPNVTDAEDIVQQTALALWEKFDAYDPTQPFTPWACRFALNKARQWIERSNGAARDACLLRVELHARLASDRDDLFSRPEQVSAGCRPAEITTGNELNNAPSNPAEPQPRSRWVHVPALGACVVVRGIGAWSLWLGIQPTRTETTTAAVDGRAGQVVHYVNGLPVARQGLKLRPPYRLGPAELGNRNANNGPHPAPALVLHLSGAVDEFEFSTGL